MAKLETYIGFDPYEMVDYFQDRKWPAPHLIPVSEMELAPVKRGAALECADGRFDQLPDRKAYGIRVFGGINAIMAIHTGGNEKGLVRAKYLVKKFGASPGTHTSKDGGCGYANLWMAGDFKHALYPYELDEMIERGSSRAGNRLADIMRHLGGKHFMLNGNHQEVGIRINPFIGYTEAATDGKRFRVDDWFMAGLGITDELRFHKIAESVELLRPVARKLEVIVPDELLLAA